MDILTGLLLTTQILVAFALIAIVLIQQTDNSGLGLGGSSGGSDGGSSVAASGGGAVASGSNAASPPPVRT